MVRGKFRGKSKILVLIERDSYTNFTLGGGGHDGSEEMNVLYTPSPKIIPDYPK